MLERRHRAFGGVVVTEGLLMQFTFSTFLKFAIHIASLKKYRVIQPKLG